MNKCEPPDDGAGSETMKHSPLPWRALQTYVQSVGYRTVADCNRSTTDYDSAMADAEFIVEACNNYERVHVENARLREALEKHGKHLLGCGLFKRGDEWRDSPSRCTCGLSAALSSSQVTTKQAAE